MNPPLLGKLDRDRHIGAAASPPAAARQRRAPLGHAREALAENLPVDKEPAHGDDLALRHPAQQPAVPIRLAFPLPLARNAGSQPSCEAGVRTKTPRGRHAIAHRSGGVAAPIENRRSVFFDLDGDLGDSHAPSMRVLGIDPGTQHLGLGLVERRGGRMVHVAHLLLRPRDFEQLPDKLAYLFDGISAVLSEHRPDAVAVEGVFHARNARSAIVLAHARGVAILCAARAGLPTFEYPPATVKKAVGVSGAAPKDVVMRMVCSLLRLDSIERSDCADALAIAVCHLNHALPAAPAGGYTIVRRA